VPSSNYAKTAKIVRVPVDWGTNCNIASFAYCEKRKNGENAKKPKALNEFYILAQKYTQ